MKIKLAQLISIILHPISIPIGIIFLLFNNNELYLFSSESKQKLLLITFIFTFIFPVLSLLILRYYKIINSIEMKTHKERFVPLLISSFFYLLNSLITYQIFYSLILLKYLLVGIIILLLIAFISTKWKISIHLSGMGTLLGFCFTIKLDFYLILIILFLSFLLAISRFYLKRHDILQLLAGFSLGFLCIFQIHKIDFLIILILNLY